jgi:ribosomal protein S12 methylthiotransferase
MIYSIHTLGCPKNDADSAVLAALIEQNGHKVTTDVENADRVLINTCGFILDARQESIDALLQFSRNRAHPNQQIIGWGCLVQRYGQELIREIPEIDGWIGVQDLEAVYRLLESSKPIRFSSQPPDPMHNLFRQKVSRGQASAYVKIGDGCDRACGFCSIPSFKGVHRSRPWAKIIQEMEDLVTQGIKEMILVDQDTTQYQDGPVGLPELLRRIDGIEGDFWIRVLYIHPDHLSKDLISTMIGLPKVLPYFDLPTQHGSDAMLQRMNRKKNRIQLLEQIQSIRALDPLASIRSTVIVGCPEETDGDFDLLMDFVQRASFDHLGCFIYSMEEGTAMEQKEPVPVSVAKDRQEQIMMAQEEISAIILQNWIGKELRVLVEEREPDGYVGRSFRDAPEIDGMVWLNSHAPLRLGDFVLCRVVDSMEHDLVGDVL